MTPEPSTNLCFIATAMDGEYRKGPLQRFLRFRDRRLSSNRVGRVIVDVYYLISPFAAKTLVRHPLLRRGARWSLHVLAKAI
ncbi:CFI-box-CTERM domain-containing protein [Mesorhizobium sp.]